MFNALPPITNPIVFRASAVLLGANAWDVTPTVVACPQQSKMVLYISYTRGAAGGWMDFQIQVSPYSVDPALGAVWFTQTEYSAAVLAAGVDSASRIQREYITYQATAAAIESFVYGPVDLGAGVERVRVTCREGSGVAVGIAHVVGIVYSPQ